jgi:hypothetical protein
VDVASENLGGSLPGGRPILSRKRELLLGEL